MFNRRKAPVFALQKLLTQKPADFIHQHKRLPGHSQRSFKRARQWHVHKGWGRAFCSSFFYGISYIEQNDQDSASRNLVTGAQRRTSWANAQKRRARSAVQKYSVCCRRTMRFVWTKNAFPQNAETRPAKKQQTASCGFTFFKKTAFRKMRKPAQRKSSKPHHAVLCFSQKTLNRKMR